MREENSEPCDARREELVCAGIWGGIRDLDQDVVAGPLLASIYSSSSDGGKGGDIYYFGVCRGDRLFVYTDGVTEAPDSEGKLFGMEQLREVLNASRDARLPELKLAVLSALQRHTDSELKHDDVTLIAMEVR